MNQVTQEQALEMVQRAVDSHLALLQGAMAVLEPDRMWKAKTLLPPSGFEPWRVSWFDPENAASPGSRATTIKRAVEAGIHSEDSVVSKVIPGPLRLASKAVLSAWFRTFSLEPRLIERSRQIAKGVWDGAKLYVGAKLLQTDVPLLIEMLIDQHSLKTINTKFWSAVFAAHSGRTVAKPFQQSSGPRYYRREKTRILESELSVRKLTARARGIVQKPRRRGPKRR